MILIVILHEFGNTRKFKSIKLKSIKLIPNTTLAFFLYPGSPEKNIKWRAGPTPATILQIKYLSLGNISSDGKLLMAGADPTPGLINSEMQRTVSYEITVALVSDQPPLSGWLNSYKFASNGLQLA